MELSKKILNKEVNSKLNLNSLIKNKKMFEDVLKKFDLKKLEKLPLDKKILKILGQFREQKLLPKICKSMGEEFEDACGQYSTGLAMVLFNVDPLIDILELRGYEIELLKLKQGKIVKVINDKWRSLGFVPHTFLGFKIGRSKYIVDAKYFDSKGKSELKFKFHANFVKGMTVKHKENMKKSGVFLKYTKPKIKKHDFNEFPVFIKDKKGETVAYKVCLRKELSFS